MGSHVFESESESAYMTGSVPVGHNRVAWDQSDRQMREATFSELRNHAREFFDMVEAGESVRILLDGKPVADLVPIRPRQPSWQRRKASPLVVAGAPASQSILDERG